MASKVTFTLALPPQHAGEPRVFLGEGGKESHILVPSPKQSLDGNKIFHTAKPISLQKGSTVKYR